MIFELLAATPPPKHCGRDSKEGNDGSKDGSQDHLVSMTAFFIGQLLRGVRFLLLDLCSGFGVGYQSKTINVFGTKSLDWLCRDTPLSFSIEFPKQLGSVIGLNFSQSDLLTSHIQKLSRGAIICQDHNGTLTVHI